MNEFVLSPTDVVWINVFVIGPVINYPLWANLFLLRQTMCGLTYLQVPMQSINFATEFAPASIEVAWINVFPSASAIN